MSPEAIRIPSAGAVFWAEAIPIRPRPCRARHHRTAAGTGGDHDQHAAARHQPGTDGRGMLLVASPIYYDHTPTETELATAPTVPAVTLAGTCSRSTAASIRASSA